MKTYDILNAGPRNRFMANGRIVSNSGQNVQLQNLKRPDKAVEKKYDLALSLMETGSLEDFKREFESPISVISSCVRSAFCASPGKRLIVCDLGAIENRGLGWLAGCDGILKVFRDGLDPYISFAVLLYNKPYDQITKEERQMAKPAVLGAGYQLSGGKLALDKDGNEIKTGLWGYAENMGVSMSQEDAERAIKIFRDSYPEVTRLWESLEEAAKEAIRHPNHTVVSGKVAFRYLDKLPLPVLALKLPSGRKLHYVNPRIQKGKILYDGMAHVAKTEAPITVWGPTATYGGKLTENIVQALSRDILVEGMFNAVKAGFSILGHCHDEIISEIAEDSPLTLEDLRQCMIQPPTWCADLPLDAAGYSGYYYMKG